MAGYGCYVWLCYGVWCIRNGFRYSEIVNAKDKQDLELVIYRLDEQEKKIDALKSCMDTAHTKNDESLKFIKENLFNPEKGLWAETKLNSQFRESSQKWRTMIGIPVIGMVIKSVYEMITSNS